MILVCPHLKHTMKAWTYLNLVLKLKMNIENMENIKIKWINQQNTITLHLWMSSVTLFPENEDSHKALISTSLFEEVLLWRMLQGLPVSSDLLSLVESFSTRNIWRKIFWGCEDFCIVSASIDSEWRTHNTRIRINNISIV